MHLRSTLQVLYKKSGSWQHNQVYTNVCVSRVWTPFFFLSIFDVICDWLFIFLRLLIVFPFRFSFNSLSNICCSFTFNSAGLYFALWTSLWADKYTNLLGNLFFNGFTYGKILFLFLNFFYQNVIYYILYYVIKFLWHLNFTM